MATIDYYATISHFEMLNRLKGNWQLLFDSSVVVAKDDTINVIEVDGVGDPTGATMTAVVVYTDSRAGQLYIEGQILCYCNRT